MTQTDNFVLSFINGQRMHISDSFITDLMKNNIKESFKEILDSVIKICSEDLPIKIIIGESFNKYSEMLPVRVKKDRYVYYLVYDHHLSELNRYFNTFFYSKQDIGHDIWKLSYELFAEEALLADEELLITYFGLNKAALGPFDVQNERECELVDFMCSIQEKYIIAHEIGHFLYAMFLHNDKRIEINLTIDLNDFIDEVLQSLEDIYLQFSHKLRIPEYSLIINEQVKIIRGGNEIVEECIADAIAIAFIFSNISKKYPNNDKVKIRVMQALFVEMMTLQLLAIHHMTVCERSFENEVSIRIAFFRNHISLYFDKNKELFEEELENTVKQYENKILTPMLECFNVLEEREQQLCNMLISDNGELQLEQLIGLNT